MDSHSPIRPRTSFMGMTEGNAGITERGAGMTKKKGGGWEGDRLEQLTQSLDKIREKFGSKAVTRASLLK